MFEGLTMGKLLTVITPLHRKTKRDYTSRMVDNIYHYIDWLNKCRIIVSNDSLGLHLVLALKKKVLGLFCPTSDKEVFTSTVWVVYWYQRDILMSSVF